MHLILACLERDAGYDGSCFDAACRTRLAMTCHEAMFKDMVERMLHACERLGGVVILVVDMEITASHGFARLIGEEIVVDEGFGCFGGELHHHAGGGVGVHVGVLAGDVVVLGLYNLQKDVARLCAAGYGTFVAVGDIFLCHLLAGRLHEFELHAVLNLLHRHLLGACHANAVGDPLNQRFVLAHGGLEHGLAYGGFDFFFVIAYDSAVAFDYSLYHLG